MSTGDCGLSRDDANWPYKLDRLPWRALHSEQTHFRVAAGPACRYAADVSPFAAIADNAAASLARLRPLLAPGETVYLMGDAPPEVPGLINAEQIPVLQMAVPARRPESFPASFPASAREGAEIAAEIVRLTPADAGAMLTLITRVFPGFYRSRTHEMGVYYGIRDGDQLVAMGGERLAVPGCREVSAVCTHPDYTGRGYAARLISRLLRDHAAAGLLSFLHVHEANERAIGLYKRLGFSDMRRVLLHPVRPANEADGRPVANSIDA